MPLLDTTTLFGLLASHYEITASAFSNVSGKVRLPDTFVYSLEIETELLLTGALPSEL